VLREQDWLSKPSSRSVRERVSHVERIMKMQDIPIAEVFEDFEIR
jgi:hypothetical protein